MLSQTSKLLGAVAPNAASPAEPDAVGVSEAARRAGVSRTFLYEALNPELAAEAGIPHLPSLKIGKRRLVRTETLRRWLASLEKRAA